METNIFSFIKRKIYNLISDKKFSEILTGSAWALGARVISAVLALATTVIIARWYGAEVLGIVAVINSFLMLATIFTVLGTDTSILRLIPEHLFKYSPTSAFKVYRKTQFLAIVVSLLTGTLFYFGANVIAEKIFNKPHMSFYFALAAVFIVFKSLMLLNTSAVRGLKLIRAFALMNTFPQGFNLLLLLVLGFYISSMSVPVYALLGSFALTAIMGWLIMEYYFKKKMRPAEYVYSMSVNDILSISFPMLMTTSMTIVIGQTGIVVLIIFRSEAEVGYYTVALKLSILTVFVIDAITTIAAPKFSELFHSKKNEDLFTVAKKTTKLTFWITAPIFFLLILFGQIIIANMFGEEFLVAYPAMVLLILGQFVHCLTGPVSQFMNMTGNQKVFGKIIAIAALLNIIINFTLTPKLGIYGSALAFIVSLYVYNISSIIYTKHKYKNSMAYIPNPWKFFSDYKLNKLKR